MARSSASGSTTRSSSRSTAARWSSTSTSKRVARGNAVAQEYQVVYAVELDEQGKLKDGEEPEYVEGQYNIYDSVPGMDEYSPLWQFNYVVVPRDYEPNSLRSERACLEAGYPIRKSTVAEN